MILEAINTILTDADITCFPLTGDVDATPPFAVFSNQQTPVRVKEGTIGYKNSVVITAIAETVNECVSLSNAISLAILSASGTINDTEIEFSDFVGGDPFFDEKLQIIRCDNEFSIDTKNT